MKRLAWFMIACGCGVGSATPTLAEDAGGGDVSSPIACARDMGSLSVVPNDVLGYPPYAMHDCRVAYVDAQTGALLLVDLSGSGSQTLEPSQNLPQSPTVAQDVIAWEATIGSQEVVRVLYRGAVATVAVPAGYHHLSEPAAATSVVAVTAWKTADFAADTDVLAFDPSAGAFTPVATGPKQQRFAAVGATIIAVTDFTEDPNGYYTGSGGDLADIGVFDRVAAAYTVRHRPGKDAFPAIVSNDVLGYLHWAEVHPEPKLEAYSLYTARISTDPATDMHVADVTHALAFVRPSAGSGVLEWVTRSDSGASTLWRFDATSNVGSAVAALTLQGQSLLGSVTVDQGTLIAASSVLRIVVR